MPRLKVPSLQHLARNWKPDSGHISRDLVRLAKNPPVFNYNPVFSATYDLLHFGQPVAEVLEGIRRKEKRESVQKNFLEIIPLIARHFADVQPGFVNAVSTRLYSIGRGIDIPFTPPLVYGLGGQLYFPWFSFWRSNPLKGDNLRLFVTVVDQVLRDDPDLEEAVFEILDFSAPQPGEERFLEVKNAAEVELLSPAEMADMLEIFADGFVKANAALETEAERAPKGEQKDDDRYSDDIQPDLFRR